MAKYNAGDIFRLDLPKSRPVSGRVVLDVYRQCVRPRKIVADSPLGFFNKSVLVEIYPTASKQPVKEGVPLLIPSFFVNPGPLESGEWQIMSFETVDPSKVEFPEALFTQGPEPRFLRGEVTLPVPLDFQEVMRVHVFPTRLASSQIPTICEHYLANDFSSKPNLANVDLRFSPHRDKVYRALGENPREPYDSFSKRFGFDLARFYETAK